MGRLFSQPWRSAEVASWGDGYILKTSACATGIEWALSHGDSTLPSEPSAEKKDNKRKVWVAASSHSLFSWDHVTSAPQRVYLLTSFLSLGNNSQNGACSQRSVPCEEDQSPGHSADPRVLSSPQGWPCPLSRCPPALRPVPSPKEVTSSPLLSLVFGFYPWVLQPRVYSQPFFFHYFCFFSRALWWDVSIIPGPGKLR